GNQALIFNLQKVLTTFQNDPDRVQDLDPATLFARLTDLAIFPPGEEIPVSVLGSAWRVFSGDSRYDPSGGGHTAVAVKNDPLAASSASQQTRSTAEPRLASLTNALCTAFYEGGVFSHYDRSRRTAVIDPTLADYLLAQHTPADLTHAQTKFLANYDTDPQGLVSRLLAAPNDERPYLWQFLPHHMQSAGQVEQLCALVQQRDYLAGKLVVLNATAVEDDILLAQNITFALETFDALEVIRQQWGRIAHLLERTRQKTQTQTSDLLQRWRILSQTLAFWLPQTSASAEAVLCQPLAPPILLEPTMRRVLDHATYTANDNTAVNQNEANVHSVASTPDGSVYITGLADGRLVGWSAVTGEQFGVWHRHNNLVHDVQISPSGRWLASAGLFDCMRLWAWDETRLDWEELFAFSGAAVRCQFDPTERWLAVTFDDKVCRLFALEDGRV
ncbi:MAG: hypothetical protein KDD89_15270, partial [Anaerolineales bacterium]|nr:hypothetical protein [Anaerolineales bacterium]